MGPWNNGTGELKSRGTPWPSPAHTGEATLTRREAAPGTDSEGPPSLDFQPLEEHHGILFVEAQDGDNCHWGNTLHLPGADKPCGPLRVLLSGKLASDQFLSFEEMEI